MEIEDGNARTDYNQGNHSWHFDNAYLKQGGERLIKGKQSLLEKLWNPSTMSVAQAKDLRLVFGSYLHTQQDFYAHSNYINLSDPPGIQLGDAVPPPQPALPYPCNLLSTTSLSDAGKRNLLTTAYAIPPLDAADAPIGQCAHGLVQLGIHKDWAGRAGHKEAYDSAVAASIRFADSIINDPSNNPDNVCMLMTDEPCQNSNPWVGTWSGTTTSTCGYYSGPITNTITSGGGNTLIISNFATTYTASYSGNTATSTTIGSVVLTLSGDTMTVSYPPACQTATLTRQ